jgi:hypothetical protein
MIKRPTWILLLLLALFLAAYFIITDRLKKPSAETTPTTTGNNYLITSTDGTLQSLRIVDRQENTFQMQRDSSGSWMVTVPSSGKADQALAEAAVTQVSALRIITTLDDQLNSGDAGLDSPAYTIELAFAGAVKHIIQVGDLTPINNGYYVRFDGGNFYVVSQSGIDALVGLITSPPFPATETPATTTTFTTTPTLGTVTPLSTLEVPTSKP